MDEQDVRVEIFMNELAFKVMYSIHTYRQYSLSVAYSMNSMNHPLYDTRRVFWIWQKCHIHLINYASCLYLTYRQCCICTLHASINIILTFDS